MLVHHRYLTAEPKIVACSIKTEGAATGFQLDIDVFVLQLVKSIQMYSEFAALISLLTAHYVNCGICIVRCRIFTFERY